LDWLLVLSEISQAAEGAALLTPERREFLRRAKVASELAAQARRDRLESGSTTALALDLFRQSIYWALRAQGPPNGQTSVEAVWSESQDAVLASVKAGEGELAELTSIFRSTFIELAERSPERQRALAKLCSRSSARLIVSAQKPLWRLEWARMKRVVRVLLVVLPTPLLILATLWWQNRDLARGMPWHTSSVEMECHPDRSECGGNPTNILFHTKLENSPWFEYDFGSPLQFSSVTIRNRTDYRPDLAVPLVVEASDDRKTYRELARRREVFLTWHPHFATQRARYLRVRALSKTYLHLEAIKVQP